MTSADDIDLAGIWTAAGVIVGFSVTAFTFRIQRESSIRSRSVASEVTYWFPPADFLLLLSLAIDLVGVFVLPVLGTGKVFARYALGWSLLLLTAYPFALLGHYEILFGQLRKKTITKMRDPQYLGYPWAATQEKGVLVAVFVASIAYFVVI